MVCNTTYNKKPKQNLNANEATKVGPRHTDKNVRGPVLSEASPSNGAQLRQNEISLMKQLLLKNYGASENYFPVLIKQIKIREALLWNFLVTNKLHTLTKNI